MGRLIVEDEAHHLLVDPNVKRRSL